MDGFLFFFTWEIHRQMFLNAFVTSGGLVEK
jgi:hypothetical protein